MPVVIKHSVCLLLLIYAICETAGKDKPITCHAGTFALGQQAAVTCNLHAVDNAKGSGVHMVRYQPGAPENDPGESVLVCSWVKQMESHHCDVEMNGYTFSNDSNSAVSVKIPSVRDEFAGLYICFLVPPDGTQGHPCELIVRGGTIPQTTTPGTTVKKNETWKISLIVILVTAVISIAALGLCVFYWRRRSKQRPRIYDYDVSYQPIPIQETTASLHKRVIIQPALKDLDLSKSSLQKIMDTFEQEMNRGLAAETHADADLKMFPTFVRSLPDGSEYGDFLALDLGGTNLRILYVKLAPGRPMDTHSKSCLIPDQMRKGSGTQLFDYLATCVGEFVLEHQLRRRQLYLGFTFSFPCNQDGLAVARLIHWTKGFSCDGVVGQNVCQLLQHALTMNNVPNVTVVCVVNDTVGTLLTAARENPNGNCEIGLILATGCNACYMENLDKVGTWKEEKNEPKQVIINTEWCAFGDNGCLYEFRTDFDDRLDEESDNPGKQITEKMISGKSVGELVRLILQWLTVDSKLFRSVRDKSVISERNCFQARFVSEIEQDTDGTFAATKRVLEELSLDDASLEDFKIVHDVCKLVSERAACFTAACVATLINRVNKSPVTVAVDGSLYKGNPCFQRVLRDKIQELVKPDQKFELVKSEDGSGIGAALTAAIALRLLKK